MSGCRAGAVDEYFMNESDDDNDEDRKPAAKPLYHNHNSTSTTTCTDNYDDTLRRRRRRRRTDSDRHYKSVKRKYDFVVETHNSVLRFLKTTNNLLDAPYDVKRMQRNDGTISPTDDNRGKQSKRLLLLRELQQQRIFLASEVARVLSQNQLIDVNLLEAPQTGAIATAPSEQEQPDHQHSNHNNYNYNSSLAVTLQQTRIKQKITAAYRLGGITVAIPRADSELLSIRFDICLGEDGSYVACYHAFFDLITTTAITATTATTSSSEKNTKDCSQPERDQASNDDSGDEMTHANSSNLYLRLVQHTIPSAIPTVALCEEHLGGSLFPLGDLQQTQNWKTDMWKERMRIWCRHIYRACWCWERRKQDWTVLERRQTMECSEKQTQQRSREGSHLRLRIENLSTTASDSLRQISFRLLQPPPRRQRHLQHSSTYVVLSVRIINDDWNRGLPTSVHVQQEANADQRDGDFDVTALVNTAQSAFLNKSVKEALDFLDSDEIWHNPWNS